MPRPIPDCVDSSIVEALEERGFKDIADLARQQKLPKTTVYSIVFGDNIHKTAMSYKRIAEALGWSTDKLINVLLRQKSNKSSSESRTINGTRLTRIPKISTQPKKPRKSVSKDL